MAFVKVRFLNPQTREATAGLVVDTALHNPEDMVSISRLFPGYEARLMRVYQFSEEFPTFEEAFAYEFGLCTTGASR